jgi:hypothetical protein
MANHFVAINRGLNGVSYSDFTTGTSSTASADFELRVADADANSLVMTRKDINLALKAFMRFFENSQQVNTAGFVETP